MSKSRIKKTFLSKVKKIKKEQKMVSYLILLILSQQKKAKFRWVNAVFLQSRLDLLEQ